MMMRGYHDDHKVAKGQEVVLKVLSAAELVHQHKGNTQVVA